MKFIIKHTFLNILVMWHRLKVHTEDLAPAFFLVPNLVLPIKKNQIVFIQYHYKYIFVYVFFISCI